MGLRITIESEHRWDSKTIRKPIIGDGQQFHIKTAKKLSLPRVGKEIF